MNRSTAILTALTLCLAAPLAKATEPLTAEQLDAYCSTGELDIGTLEMQLCVTYVTGFLDGAVATDERVAENVANEIERDETFTERAIRTRLTGRLRESGPTVYAEFCVGSPVPILEVVGHVVDELAERDSIAEIPAQTIVYAALRRHYPCRPATGEL